MVSNKFLRAEHFDGSGADQFRKGPRCWRLPAASSIALTFLVYLGSEPEVKPTSKVPKLQVQKKSLRRRDLRPARQFQSPRNVGLQLRENLLFTSGNPMVFSARSRYWFSPSLATWTSANRISNTHYGQRALGTNKAVRGQYGIPLANFQISLEILQASPDVLAFVIDSAATYELSW